MLMEARSVPVGAKMVTREVVMMMNAGQSWWWFRCFQKTSRRWPRGTRRSTQYRQRCGDFDGVKTQ